MPETGLHLQIDLETLGPVVERIVAEVLRQLQSEQKKMNGRLSFTEQEAADMLGMKKHQLRDLRLRGEITALKATGKASLYARGDLVEFLAAKRREAKRHSRR
jgi:hypothetical protein